MKKIIYTSVLIFSLTSWGNTAKKSIKLLNQANKAVRSGPAVQCLEGEDPSLLEACAISICGNPGSSPSSYVNDQNFDQFVQEGVKERFPELKTPVQKIYARKKKENENLIEALKQKMKTEKPFPNFSNWKNEYNDMAFDVYMDSIDFEIDMTKPLLERIKIHLTPPKNADEIFQKGLEEYAEEKKRLAFENPVVGIEMSLYSVSEAQNLVKEYRSSFLKEFEKEKTQNPKLLSSQADRLKEVLELKPEELTSALDLSNAYHTVRTLLDNLNLELKRPLLNLSRQVLCKNHCQAGIRSYVTSLNLSSIVSEIEKSRLNFKLEDALLNCQSNLVQMALKETNNEAFLAQLPALKQTFLENTFSQLSSHSRELFEAYLEQQLNLSFILEKPNTVDGIIEELNQQASEDIKETPTSTYEILQELLRSRDWADKTKFLADLNACEEYNGVSTVWDAFLPKENQSSEPDFDPTKDNIFVSLFSCSYLEHGKRIFAHELGHALSQQIKENRLSEHSKEKFLKTRNCVSQSYLIPQDVPNLDNPSQMNHAGDNYFSEEDMADVISYNTIKNDATMFSCTLLKTNPNSNQYTKLSLLQTDPFDTHSTPFMRVLREAIYKKKDLSAACLQVIEQNKTKFRFTPCP